MTYLPKRSLPEPGPQGVALGPAGDRFTPMLMNLVFGACSFRAVWAGEVPPGRSGCGFGRN
jgi:hypothetical protein